ncbi:MAG: hypothetical protein P4L68_10445 [Methylovirgula sp.]|nr:hypothetical protein [Methylovirgula sp.]
MQAQSAHPPSANDDSFLEEGVDEIIAEHGGDARAAIRALLEAVSYLEKARDRALVLVSYGYARGKVE